MMQCHALLDTTGVSSTILNVLLFGVEPSWIVTFVSSQLLS